VVTEILAPAPLMTSWPLSSPRCATSRDPDRPTRGLDVAAHLTRLLLHLPFPWQWEVADVAGELNERGDGFRYPIVVLSVPRRAGKSALMLATAFDRMNLRRDVRAWYTMQTGTACTELFRAEWAPVIDGRPKMEKIYRLRRSEGRETVEHRSGSSRVRMFAPEKDALHGMNADLVIVDEAWAFDTERGEALEAAIRPAQLTRPWRQLWIVSAGGTIESTWWDRWLTMGETSPGVAIFDYGADATDPGYDPGNPDVWARAHPTAGYGFPLDALAHEWATRRDDASFERAYLNVWPRPSTVLSAGGVDVELWKAAARPGTRPDQVTAIAVDVARDRSSASIAAAGWHDDRVAVEVIDHRPGVGWIATAVRNARQAHRGAVVLADSLVAASIVAELTRARVAVTPVGATDHARACGTFLDRLTAGTLTHRGQPVLDDAVAGAARRPLGDGWLWARRLSTVDISPLVAVTLAAWSTASRHKTGRAAVVTPPAASEANPGYPHGRRPVSGAVRGTQRRP